MIDYKRYLPDVLGTDLVHDLLFSASQFREIRQEGDDIVFTVSCLQKIPLPGRLYFEQEPKETEEKLFFRLRFYTGGIVRLMIAPTPRSFNDQSIMLEWDPGLQIQPAILQEAENTWQALGPDSAFLTIGKGAFDCHVSPDGRVRIDFQNEDQFLPNLPDALPALILRRSDGNDLMGFAFHILPGEHFCGTGERFERPDLFGGQFDLVNVDAAGVNNPRTYKNIPFLLSSRGYGLFVHSSAKMRLDIGAHSTRSLQWLADDDMLDIFLIGGGSLGKVLENYRRITGVPQLPPTWSFGVWMSRASYYSDTEVSEVAHRMRREGYPADVLHLDVGWFRKEWICDWQFSPENFPDPEDFFRGMADLGFHVSLWQYPYIRPEIALASIALDRGYVGKEATPIEPEVARLENPLPGASHRHWLGYTLDLTNPEAVAWYQGLLTPLLKMGAAAIKVDFGEEVDETAQYQMIEGRKYRNLFALIYQKAVWEATEQIYGKGNTVIWARAGWAGSQRYPVHWAGDAATTFDALAGTIRGGLHFGLSGFAFWSHDVGGIHGIPDFMNTRPSDELYVRWTQVGVFSSHIRFHGGTPREPWEYPSVAGIVREWLRFRYALLPYLLEQSRLCCQNGLPVFRSLVIDWPEDPAVWSIEDEYLFGDAFLVCPILSAAGMRNVYLPQGRWVDFWTGQIIDGPRHLHHLIYPISRIPLFVRFGSQVTFAEPVQHTGLLSQARQESIHFDENYRGFEAGILRQWVNL